MSEPIHCWNWASAKKIRPRSLRVCMLLRWMNWQCDDDVWSSGVGKGKRLLLSFWNGPVVWLGLSLMITFLNLGAGQSNSRINPMGKRLVKVLVLLFFFLWTLECLQQPGCERACIKSSPPCIRSTALVNACEASGTFKQSSLQELCFGLCGGCSRAWSLQREAD